MRHLLVNLVKLYRAIISPLWHGLVGPQAGCRFTPTCGAYAEEAFKKHGTIKGGLLAFKRVCRCHPWSKGGIDPVPQILCRDNQKERPDSPTNFQ